MSFLRKVRHQLALEGETKRHGFFMIAEMALIIVGITVALQLDNFNESSLNQKTEKALLIQLHEEFTIVKSAIEKEITTIEARIPKIVELYRNCGYNHNDYDVLTLTTEVGEVMEETYFNTYQGVLNDAMNTGKLSLVQNSDLRIKLYSWKTGVEYIHNFNNTLNNYVKKFLIYAFEKISWRDYDNEYFSDYELGKSTLDSDVNGLLFDVFFENQIGMILWNTEKLLENYEKHLLKPTNEIIGLVELELAKHPNVQLGQAENAAAAAD